MSDRGASGVQVALIALFTTALVTAQLTATKVLAFSIPFSLPTAVLFVVLFVGWVLGQDAIDELTDGSGIGSLAPIWLWGIRTVILAVVVIVVAINLWDLLATPDTGYYIVPGPLR